MLSRSVLRALAVALPLLMLAGCGDDEAQAKANGGPAERPIPVTTQQVQLTAWNDTLQALGTAKARESVTLTAKVSEIVQDVHFESGQQVRAGQVLVTLKGDAAQAALVQAEATYAEAERLYRRQKELADQQLIARSQLDTQLALRDAAAARVRQARADIADRSVRAPFAGVVNYVLGTPPVSKGEPVAMVSSFSPPTDCAISAACGCNTHAVQLVPTPIQGRLDHLMQCLGIPRQPALAGAAHEVVATGESGGTERTDQATGHGADCRAHARIALGFVHVGAARKTSHGERDRGKGDDDFLHVMASVALRGCGITLNYRCVASLL